MDTFDLTVVECYINTDSNISTKGTTFVAQDYRRGLNISRKRRNRKRSHVWDWVW